MTDKCSCKRATSKKWLSCGLQLVASAGVGGSVGASGAAQLLQHGWQWRASVGRWSLLARVQVPGTGLVLAATLPRMLTS